VDTFRLLGPDGTTYTHATPGRYGGHRRSHIFGRLDCPAALRAIQRGGYINNRVFFADSKTAVAAGYRPCGVCLPDAYQIWKVATGLAALVEAEASQRI
jgi:methylphosphotriester-DNA--protein-cysteine methyltransferase